MKKLVAGAFGIGLVVGSLLTPKVIAQGGINSGGQITRSLSTLTSPTIKGNMIFSPDNTYDIGASGATRPRILYLGSDIYVGAGSGMRFTGRGAWYSPADGILHGLNNAGTGFTRLILGTNDATVNGISIRNVGGTAVFGTGDGSANITVNANGYLNSSTAAFNWSGRSVINSPADGVLQATNAAATGFARLILGTNDATANGISIANSGGVMQFLLGDGSAFTGVAADSLRLHGQMVMLTQGDGVPQLTNAAGTGFSRLILGTNDATVNGLSIGNSAGAFTFSVGNGSALTSTRANAVFAQDSFRGPGTVASTGDIRLQYQGVVKTRNSTNLGDITVFSTGSTVANDVSIGGGSTSQITLQNVVGAINGVVADTTNTTAGVPVIVKRGRLTGQTAAVPSVATYTPTADGTFEIGAIVLVTTATNLNFGVHVTWTDEGGTARDQTISFFNPGTGFVTAMTTALGTITYNSASFPLRAKANTAITILTSGTFTTVTYNVEGIIKQIS